MSKMENEQPPPYGNPPPGGQPNVAYPPGQPGYAPGPAQPGYAPGPAQPGYAPGPAQPGYAPAQPGYAPQQQGYGGQMTNTTVVLAQPAVILHPARMSESPAQMQCPRCSAQIVTSTHYETGTLTWLAAGITCLVGCWAGCCLIPFCIDGCKDVIHTCPNCKGQVGAYRRL